MSEVYLESSILAEAFGISLSFNYRALSIILKSNFELPVIKLERIKKMRNSLAKINGDVIADTSVHRNYHLFRFGTLDWSTSSTQSWSGAINVRSNIGLGAEVLFGEAEVSANFYSQQKFDNRQLNYLWRWVDNSKRFVKQAQIGKISSQTISFINAPIIGAVIRNSPTTVRKATGYYTINEHTEPNWTIELYINNVLVDYTKADASGLFTFKVPVVYGYTTLKLKFYGPMGEERTVERTLNLPYTIMPARQFEYGLSAGIVQDNSFNRFGKLDVNYGLTRFLTLGAGMEYLSSISTGAFIPYANATLQPFSKLIINGEYIYGVRAGGLLNYFLTRDILLGIEYDRYAKGQLVTRFNSQEERKAKLTIPFRIKKMIFLTKLEFSQLVYSEFKYNLANAMLSVYYKQFSVNSTTQINWIEKRPAFITEDLALSYRLKYGFIVRSSAQLNISEGKFMMCNITIEKSIPKGYFSVTYGNNIAYNDNFVSVSFKYDLPFAKTNIAASYGNRTISTSESAQGSLAFGGGNKFIYVSNNSSGGKGGIALYPFLDLNNNGKFDAGEHMVKLSSVKTIGGNLIFSKKDSIIRIPNLNAFTSCLLEFDDNDLENISWRFKYKSYDVLIDPNQFKRIDIPIITLGEMSGMTYMKRENSMKGIGRILVKIYKKGTTTPIAETLSESDGYIYYLGLGPGEYIAHVDSVQLRNLNFMSDPPLREFTIKTVEEGDIVGGIDFVLSSKIEVPKQDTSLVIKDTLTEADTLIREIQYVDTIPEISANEKIKIKNIKIEKVEPKTNVENQLPENVKIPVWGDVCTQEGNYYVLSISFKYKFNAIKLAMYIKQNTGIFVGVVYNNGFYKVQIGCVSKRSEADKINNMLIEKKVWDNIFMKNSK